MNTAGMVRGAPHGLRVGVSIYVRKGAQSLWENGIFQNCLFLVMLLARVPQVEVTYLVAGGGDGQAVDAEAFLADSPVPVIDMAQAASQLDVMIELSAQLDREWVVAFRERGGRIASMHVGNDYVIDIERMMFDRPHALLVSGAPYDEIWTLPQYERTSAPYLRSALRAPVRVVPHLWSPAILERALKTRSADARFDYRPGRRRWRPGIFEPNICMVKTAFVPLLCCEAAHRAHPDMFEHVWAYNTWHMKDQAGFAAFAGSLDIVRHGLASFEGRFPLWQVMPDDVDVVISHHWENAQNYVYYEALYGGYPLVHNSELIGGCGYRYHGFDCEEGARALRRAFVEHDTDLVAYRRAAGAFLAQLAPEGEANVRAYGAALAALYIQP